MSALPDVTLGGGPDVHPVDADDDAPTVVAVESVHDDHSDERAVELPGSDLGGAQVTVAERVIEVARYWRSEAAETARRVTSRPGGIGAARPESWLQFRERVAARGWVPEGYAGGWVEWLPVCFYNSVGVAGWAVGAGIQWLLTHMLAFVVAFILAAAITVLWLCLN